MFCIESVLFGVMKQINNTIRSVVSFHHSRYRHSFVMSCGICDLPLTQYYHALESLSSLDMIKYLQEHGLLLKEKKCERCGSICSIDQNSKQFRCRKMVSVNKQKKKKCEFKQTIFKDSLFDNVCLPIKKILLFAILT